MISSQARPQPRAARTEEHKTTSQVYLTLPGTACGAVWCCVWCYVLSVPTTLVLYYCTTSGTYPTQHDPQSQTGLSPSCDPLWIISTKNSVVRVELCILALGLCVSCQLYLLCLAATSWPGESVSSHV